MSKHRKKLPPNTETTRETQRFNLTVERDFRKLEREFDRLEIGQHVPRPFYAGVFDPAPPKATIHALKQRRGIRPVP